MTLVTFALAYLLFATAIGSQQSEIESFKLPGNYDSMAESMQQKSEWLVIVPDVPGMAAKRFELMGQHADRRKSDPEDFWVLGGATLQEPFIPGRPPQVTGSAMLIFALTQDDILDRLKDDPLVREKVWDVENAIIYPFFRPKRTPL